MVNKQLKRSLALLLALVMLLSLAACGGNGNDSSGNAGTGGNTGTSDGTSGDSGAANPSDGTGSTDTPADPNAPQYGGVLNIRLSSDLGNFDPHLTTGAKMYNLSTAVYENPLSVDADGNICPNVCEYELSDDGLTLKLWVRDGMTFHDGSPVEIEDVVASLERAGNLVSNVKKYFAGYVEDCQIADGVATYTFKEYSFNTLYYIANLQTWAAVLPKEICEKYGEDPIIDAADAIGTGPYKLVSYESSVGYQAVRYDDYVPLEGYTGEAGPKMAYLDAINLWINQDSQNAHIAFMNGDYDICNLEEDEEDLLLNQGGYKNYASPSSKTQYLAFNVGGNRPVNDVNLRKAIIALLNLDELKQMHAIEAELDPCPIPEGNPYYSDAFKNADYLGTGAEVAQKYLDASSYNNEEIVIAVVNGALEDLAILVQAYLSDAGLNAKLYYTTDASFTKDPANEWDILLAGSTMVATNPALIPAALRSTYWFNEQKDELFATAESSLNGSEESLNAWKEIVDLWIEEAAVVCLYSYSEDSVISSDLFPNSPGYFFDVYYNTYWSNPSEHMG